MAAIVLATNYVLPNEPCFELAEVNRVRPIPGAGLRREQVIRVIRGDSIVTYRRDMGPAGKFKTEEFIFPGAVPLGKDRYEVIETVERLMGEADDFRAKYDKPYQRLRPPEDLREGFEQTAMRRWDARVGRKRFAMKGAG